MILAPMSPPPRPAPPSHPGHRLLLLAVSLTFSFLLAEGVLRVGFPQVGKLRQLVMSTDDERGFVPRPDIRLSFAGVFESLSQTVVWQTNSLGIRHEGEVGLAGPRFRVVTYGDSETFGWSVALEDTFQRQMEAIDPRVQVLNLGVPGYNVTNVREHMERTLPRLQPDLVIYLVNKNDFNEPVGFTPLSHSHVLLHLRFLWHFSIGKQLRLASRDDSERLETFGLEVERMTHLLETRDTPFLVGFLKWKNHKSVKDYPAAGRAEASSASRRFHRQFVNVMRVTKNEPKEDTHYARSAHLKMAALFCDVISGRQESVPADLDAGAPTCLPNNEPAGQTAPLSPH